MLEVSPQMYFHEGFPKINFPNCATYSARPPCAFWARYVQT